MDKSKNIYSYKPSKSENYELHYFLTKGRITRKAFFLRLMLVLLLLTISNLIFHIYAQPQYIYWEGVGNGVVRNTRFLITYSIFKGFNNVLLPTVLSIFIAIQAVKRMHDVNKSGWSLLSPVQNAKLLFAPGTLENNNYGIDPKPQAEVKYFDEYKKKL